MARGSGVDSAAMATETVWQAKRGARSNRGEARRAALVTAAEEVFCRVNYDDVRVADIVEAAGTSHGTFYKYFPSKEAIFEELVQHLQEEILGRRDGEWDEGRKASLVKRIERGNRRYLEVFARYANIMVTVDYSPSMQLKPLQGGFRQHFVERIERSIKRWQSEGLIDRGIDPYYAAYALGGMVSRFAYVMFVLGEPFEKEKAVQQLTRLWANALRLDEGKEAKGR